MAITERAQAIHDRLFPEHRSTLGATDPELVEVFGNFAFDDVLRHADLEARTRLHVILAALVAMNALGEFRVMAGAALTIGVTASELKEIVYQAVPYAGMGRAYEFVHATNDLLREHGITLPLAPQATTSRETRCERGLATQRRIVGADTVEKLYASAPDDQQHIQCFLSANCFGDYVARSGLDLATRELLTFAMLVALGGCDPQVKAHVTANANVGNDRARLIAVLTHLIPYVGYPRTLNGLRAVDDALPAATTAATS